MPRATFLRVVCSCSALVVLVATHTQLLAQSPPGMSPAIQANPNRVPAGRLENGILTLHLELRQGDWYPEADTGPSMKVYAFAEEGKALQVPGPLIRVPEGTEIHVTLHNLLPAAAIVHGLHQHPGDAKAVVEVPPQETRELAIHCRCSGHLSILRKRRWSLGRLRSPDSRRQSACRGIRGRSSWGM